MFIYIISAAYWFCTIVQYAVIAYTVVSWIKSLDKLQNIMADIMDPLLSPVRKMLMHSVFRLRSIDISPIIVYLLAGYIAQLCLMLR